MASDIWLRTILIVRKETRCRHIGYSYRLTARVLLYVPSHRQDNTYHSLCYTSLGALAGTRKYHTCTHISQYTHTYTHHTRIHTRTYRYIIGKVRINYEDFEWNVNLTIFSIGCILVEHFLSSFFFFFKTTQRVIDAFHFLSFFFS